MRESGASGWSEVKVAEVIERHFCGPSPDCEERPVFHDDEWGVLKTTAITWSGWNQDAHKVLPRAYWGREGIEVRAGDVLVTKAGPRHRVAVVTHVPATRRQLVVSGKMIGLRPRVDAVLPEVLAGLLALPESQKYIHDRTTGMAESQVNFANVVLLNAPLRIPPKEEQSAIARIGTVLDMTIRQTEAIIEKLKQVKQGLLNDLLTRGIDANGELRPPQSQAPHLYRDSPLGWIPREWEAKTLDELVDQRRPIVYGILMPGQGHEGGVPVVKVKDIVGGSILLDQLLLTSPQIDREYRRSRLMAGDLLFTIRGSVGRTAFVPNQLEKANITQDTARIGISGLDARFVREYLAMSVPVRFISTHTLGVAVQGINLRDVRRIPVAAPAAEEARHIADRFEAINERIAAENLVAKKLSLRRTALMNDLLTGRVSVISLVGHAQ